MVALSPVDIAAVYGGPATPEHSATITATVAALQQEDDLVTYLVGLSSGMVVIGKPFAFRCVVLAASKNGYCFVSNAELYSRIDRGLIGNDVTELITYENPIPDPWPPN